MSGDLNINMKISLVQKYGGRGFTLIELLMVVAIIGMLSSIVLASLSNARTRGADAAIKQTLSGIRNQAQLLYDENNGNYSGVCTVTANSFSQKIKDMMDGASIISTGTASPSATACNPIGGTTPTGYTIYTTMKSQNLYSASPPSGTDYWCVDYLGKSKLVDSPVAANTPCP